METMYAPQNNGPHTLLTGAINSAVTSVTVEDASVLPDAPNVLTIGLDEDAELVLMHSKTGNILAVERGFNGTTPKEWRIGDWVYRAITAQDISALQANVQETRDEIPTGLKSGATREIQCGAVTFTMLPNETASIAVTFPTPFSGTPRIALGLNNNTPYNKNIGFGNPTSTGVTLYCYYSGAATGASVTIHWTAVY